MTMEAKPNPQLLYTSKALEACEKALRTILKKIGPWGTQLVLIGGMTPKYLVGNAPKEIKEHVGTTDLDVVVGVSLSTQEEEAYRTLQQNLKDSGFAPGKNQETAQEETFRWGRNVDGVKVALEFFCPVGDGIAGRLYRNPGKNVGSKISAIRIRGAELAGRDNFTVMLSGDTLDEGGIKDGVPARVANFLPFFVLKAFAIEERDKAKDSYDVIWTLNAYKSGPQSVIEEMAKSPVLDHADVAVAIGYLRNNFATIDHSGPAQYAAFEQSGGGDAERVALRRYAHGTMAEFLKHWDESKLPSQG